MRDISRDAAIWALAVSAVTSLVSSIGRTFCLPPYWTQALVLRCRTNDMAAAIARLPLDFLATTLMLFIPALALGVALRLLWEALFTWWTPRAADLSFALLGAAAWPPLVERLEPSHLDFIIGWYAVAFGVMIAGIVGGWYLPRLRQRLERSEVVSPNSSNAIET